MALRIPFRALRSQFEAWTFIDDSSSHRRNRCLSHLSLETLESRCLLSGSGLSGAGFRPISEIGNNVANPTEGTAGTDLLRISPAAYADGISSPSLPGDQSARAISDIVNSQADPSDPSQDLNTDRSTALSISATRSANSWITTWT